MGDLGHENPILVASGRPEPALLVVKDAIFIHVDLNAPVPVITWNHDNLLSYIEQEAAGPTAKGTQGGRPTRKLNLLRLTRHDGRVAHCKVLD